MKRLTLALVILVVIVLALAAAGQYAARRAIAILEQQRHNILGLAIDIGGAHLDWRGAAITLDKIKLYPAGKEEARALLASADSLTLSIAPRDIFKKVLHVRELILTRPTISVVQEKPGTLNWTSGGIGSMNAHFQLGDAPASTPPEALQAPQPPKSQPETTPPSTPGESWQIVIDSIRIVEGSADYHDLIKGQHLALRELNLTLSEIQSESDPDKLPSNLALNARIGDTSGRLSVKGNLNVFAPGINFNLTATISGTPITYFHAFYAGATPFPIESGTIAISSSARASKSQLRSNHHASISGLRVSGGIKADLINQFVLAHAGPIGADVSVNGDLSEGKLAVSAALSRGIFDSILDQAEKFSPLALGEKAGQEIVSGTKEVGQTVGNGTKEVGSSVSGGAKSIGNDTKKAGKAVTGGIKKLFH